MTEPTNRNGPKGRSPAAKRRVRRVVLVFFALVVAGLVVVSLIPEPVPVDVVAVRRADLRVAVDEDGTTRVKDRYVVAAPLAGSLARVEFRAGDVIREGDVIARILPSSAPLLDARTRAELGARVAAASAGIRQAESGAARARSAADLSSTELERTRILVARGGSTAQLLERSEAEAQIRREDVASADFAVRIARHQLAMAQAASGDASPRTAESPPFEVQSPISGRVLRVLQASAAPVAPGTPIVEIGDPSALEIVVDVLTSDAVRIRPGARVTIDRWGGVGALQGRVRMVEPSAFTKTSALGVEEQRVDVIVDLVEPHERWSALGDGYRVLASIVVDESRHALVVPELAMFRLGDADALYEVVDGRARLRRVRVGRRNGIDVEILAGLSERARVIVHPSERVVDEARVARRE